MIRRKAGVKRPLLDKDLKAIFRIIDANLNRSTEGLRVCEDVARFVLNDKALAVSFKTFRHKLKNQKTKISLKFDIISVRNVKSDVGRKTKKSDFLRKGFSDVFSANAQRVKEALRSLEEVSKLIGKGLSEGFKRIRFRFYAAEKKAIKKISLLRNSS